MHNIAPAVTVVLPSGQGEHTALPRTGLYVDSGHGSHTGFNGLLPARTPYPAGHSHSVPFTLASAFCWHGVHCDEPDTGTTSLGNEQLRHALMPVPFAYVPGSQAAQLEPPEPT